VDLENVMPGMYFKYIGEKIQIEKNAFITVERSIAGRVNIGTDLDVP
jgi:hypothetical protein